MQQVRQSGNLVAIGSRNKLLQHHHEYISIWREISLANKCRLYEDLCIYYITSAPIQITTNTTQLELLFFHIQYAVPLYMNSSSLIQSPSLIHKLFGFYLWIMTYLSLLMRLIPLHIYKAVKRIVDIMGETHIFCLLAIQFLPGVSDKTVSLLPAKKQWSTSAPVTHRLSFLHIDFCTY